jgi:hypothetical protein
VEGRESADHGSLAPARGSTGPEGGGPGDRSPKARAAGRPAGGDVAGHHGGREGGQGSACEDCIEAPCEGAAGGGAGDAEETCGPEAPEEICDHSTEEAMSEDVKAAAERFRAWDASPSRHVNDVMVEAFDLARAALAPVTPEQVEAAAKAVYYAERPGGDWSAEGVVGRSDYARHAAAAILAYRRSLGLS